MSRKPVVFDLQPEDEPKQSVSDAPPVPDLDEPTALQATVEAMGEGRRSGWGGWIWAGVAGLITTIVSVAAWDYATSLLDRIPVLGLIVSAALIGLALAALLFCLRELAAVARVRRVDDLRQACAKARTGTLKEAQTQVAALQRFYAGRADLEWAQRNLSDRKAELLDADALIDLAEAELMRPLDARAVVEVEAAARQVAGVTALVPLALADVLTALVSSLRMIRRIAEIYGGRSGFFSSWRLTRAVLSHLVATGAVAVGDDLLEPVLGASVLSKLSRRFGEGLVNGALTARVGLAAIEVCRPMGFEGAPKPRLGKVLQRALRGFVK
ncbi:YcjF family protein [Tritonibacter scottomollicae]|uniref:Putative membrane protein n=1 Tax=Tritonibacter scottomollicae TaxID=483013 RepID=A0A2T1ANV1_TRISK|nr:YcjF family protein [Tritonibacter scottomollicae]PRZ50286.1 putative membrane protein [Tritonibacter scottomollicae]